MNGEGTQPRLRKDGRYESKHTAHTPKGPRRRIVCGRTAEECLLNLQEVLAQQRGGGLAIDPKKLTIGQFMARWLEDTVKGTVRVITYNGHLSVFRTRIVPDLGGIALKKLSPAHIHAWLAIERDADVGATPGGRLSASSSEPLPLPSPGVWFPRTPPRA
jgi:integrase